MPEVSQVRMRSAVVKSVEESTNVQIWQRYGIVSNSLRHSVLDGNVHGQLKSFQHSKR